jgi:hypothetical protein
MGCKNTTSNSSYLHVHLDHTIILNPWHFTFNKNGMASRVSGGVVHVTTDTKVPKTVEEKVTDSWKDQQVNTPSEP